MINNLFEFYYLQNFLKTVPNSKQYQDIIEGLIQEVQELRIDKQNSIRIFSSSTVTEDKISSKPTAKRPDLKEDLL